MSRMLDAEELDFSFGQHDSLTHRLSVLLQDYTDGFAVPKELVQNADDAGATEVSNIMIIWYEQGLGLVGRDGKKACWEYLIF